MLRKRRACLQHELTFLPVQGNLEHHQARGSREEEETFKALHTEKKALHPFRGFLRRTHGQRSDDTPETLSHEIGWQMEEVLHSNCL